ncbi:MAG TPA: oligoendopeptidase, partial [Acidimicrobiales bacterium]
MADTLSTDLDAPDHVHWDLEPLVGGEGLAGVERLLDQADVKAAALAEKRGHVAELDAAGLAELMDGLAALEEDLTRADSYAGLRFAT